MSIFSKWALLIYLCVFEDAHAARQKKGGQNVLREVHSSILIFDYT